MVNKMITLVSFLLCTVVLVYSQQIGTQQAESHPPLSLQICEKGGSCTKESTSIVLDSNWRWAHSLQGTDNCYTGNEWDKKLCPNNAECAKNCAIDGADYPGTYGIHASGDSLKIDFVTHGPYSTNIGSRVYLMKDDNSYYMFKLKNREFTFDVDVSNMPCGLNGALYFVEMSADGGKGIGANAAGAKYGTGYCDAQCPHDLKWQMGEGNVDGWKASPDDPNSGVGKYGSCCTEMDIWEANSVSSAYTPHVCTTKGLLRCEGAQCGDDPDNRYGGVCDKDGCDFNTYRVGVKNFYGKGLTVDTGSKITVVTQFITTDGTDNGDLTEIRRLWVQNGKVIGTPAVQISGVKPYTSVTDAFCSDLKGKFGDKNDFIAKGGLKALGDKAGMVLVMSLWDDHAAHMLWLDSNYPTNKDDSTPGVGRGTCPITSGVPKDVETQFPNSSVTFSNIKFGAINSTYSH